MGLFRGIVKRLALFAEVMLTAEHDGDSAFQHKAEFFALVRDIARGGGAFRQFHENGFHHVFLRVGNQPLEEHAVRILLEEFFFRKDDFFFRFLPEEFREIAAERGKNIGKRGDRRAVYVVIQLGNIAFGQLAAVRQFFLRQAFLVAHFSDLFAQVHKSASFSVFRRVGFVKVNFFLGKNNPFLRFDDDKPKV